MPRQSDLRRFRVSLAVLVVALAAGLLAFPAWPEAQAAGDFVIYGDALAAGWQDDWSWNTTRNLGNASPVQGGSASIAVTYTVAWAGFFIHSNSAINTAGYDRLRFWINGGASGGQPVRVAANGDNNNGSVAVTATANTWTQVDVPLSSLGSPATIDRLWWQEDGGSARPTFYLDNITLIASSGPPTSTPPPGSGPALSVNAAAGRKPISPYIYGLNFADEALADELDLPVNRWGGNSTTRYNWQNDISNHAFDWYFENIKESDATNLPTDSAANRFIEQNQPTGAATLLTVPMIGYVSNNNAQACGFDTVKYAYTAQPVNGLPGTDVQWRPTCGTGIHNSNGAYVTGNDPLDTSLVIAPSFVGNWVTYLKGRYGSAANGGVRFYNLDNEADIWFETHRDVFPLALTYDQFRDRTLQYAAAIKAADPTAQTLGPVVNGWTYYWHSPRDGQNQDWATPDDRNAHGGTPFVPWYLQHLRAYEQANGVRLLDYLDLHYYPQAGGVSLSGAGSAATQALRLRTTRSLWDPTYVDESWIAQAGPESQVKLIPRMRAWVDANYPGTKLAISEYNWGALDHINGALAQADVLGIFEREGLDLATLWGPPASNEPGAYAFRMYRNYDGAGGKFGDTSVSATSGDQDQIAIYAAQRTADFALTVMVINKTSSALTSPLSLAGYLPAASAQVYRYSSANLNAIVRAADLAVGAGGFTATFPANSITLIVVPAGTPPQQVFLPMIRR